MFGYPDHHRVWLYTPSKGWGYTFRVPCVVVGKGRARTKIAALAEAGNLRTRFVKAEHLVAPKNDHEGAICASVQTHWNEAHQNA